MDDTKWQCTKIRGSVGRACVAHLSFYCEETLHRTFHIPYFYQISVHLATWFQRRRIFFRNQPIRNKNCVWWPCLLTDRDKMSNYRGTSIDVSYQVSVHLAKRFKRRRLFRNQSIRNKNCLCWPCSLMDRDERRLP